MSARGHAQIHASFEAGESQGWRVSAPGLEIDVRHPAFTSWREPSSVRIVADGVPREETFDGCDAYRLMVDAVSARVRGEDAWVLPLSASLAVARATDLVAAAARANGSAPRLAGGQVPRDR